MAQNILARAINGPQPETCLRTFLTQASLDEIEQVEQALLVMRVARQDSDRPEDQALVRVCDRWLELVQEYKILAALYKNARGELSPLAFFFSQRLLRRLR